MVLHPEWRDTVARELHDGEVDYILTKNQQSQP